jgi:hypothetical protein
MTDTPSWGLVLVRIVVGFILLVAGWTKLQQGVGEELVTHANEAYAASPELVRSFGENVVLKHPWFFSQAVVFGEILCGLCLFLGMFGRRATSGPCCSRTGGSQCPSRSARCACSWPCAVSRARCRVPGGVRERTCSSTNVFRNG